jgi:hypothetical protein
MTGRAHVIVALLTLASLCLILRLVRRRQLRAKYSIMWMSVGAMLVVLAAWPGLLVRVSRVVGIYYAPATFFLGAFVLLFVIAIHFSWELSRLEDRTRKLAEQMALLQLEKSGQPAEAAPEPAREPE